jgi:glycosyltransferase involved in cell wall biosynthesis
MMIRSNPKRRFLFVMEMTRGNATFYYNLRSVLDGRNDVICDWLPIDYHPTDRVGRLPLISRNWSVRAGMVARSRVRSLEKAGLHYDAAFFHGHIPALFLRRFRRRVRTIVSLDATPLSFDELAEAYDHVVRTRINPVERLKHKVTQSVYQDAVLLLPWSSWASDSLVEDYGIPSEKIRVVHPGVNTKTWCPTRSRLSRINRPVTVLFVGGDFKRKGGDLVLTIARRSEFEDCRFQVVTSAMVPDAPPNATFHPGLASNSPELIALYNEADIFVLPTRGDTYGLAVSEAMAMGLPVITTGVGGMESVLAGSGAAMFVPADNVEALAQKLHVLVHQPEVRAKLGTNARRFAEVNLDIERNAEMILEYLHETSEKRFRPRLLIGKRE